MKSSYQLAMERLVKRDGKSAAVPSAKKQALADADSRMQARIAEVEVLKRPQISVASAKGDLEKAAQIEAEMRAAIAAIRAEGTAEKDRIRKSM